MQGTPSARLRIAGNACPFEVICIVSQHRLRGKFQWAATTGSNSPEIDPLARDESAPTSSPTHTRLHTGIRCRSPVPHRAISGHPWEERLNPAARGCASERRRSGAISCWRRRLAHRVPHDQVGEPVHAEWGRSPIAALGGNMLMQYFAAVFCESWLSSGQAPGAAWSIYETAHELGG